MPSQRPGDQARLERLFGTPVVQSEHLKRLRASMTPEMRAAIRQMLADHEKQLNELRDELDGYEETKDRLRITQLALIVALQRMGGSFDLYAGELNSVPAGSVVKVDKLEKGEGNSVPLRVSWRGPDVDKPATTDVRPGS